MAARSRTRTRVCIHANQTLGGYLLSLLFHRKCGIVSRESPSAVPRPPIPAHGSGIRPLHTHFPHFLGGVAIGGGLRVKYVFGFNPIRDELSAQSEAAVLYWIRSNCAQHPIFLWLPAPLSTAAIEPRRRPSAPRAPSRPPLRLLSPPITRGSQIIASHRLRTLNNNFAHFIFFPIFFLPDPIPHHFLNLNPLQAYSWRVGPSGTLMRSRASTPRSDPNALAPRKVCAPSLVCICVKLFSPCPSLGHCYPLGRGYCLLFCLTCQPRYC